MEKGSSLERKWQQRWDEAGLWKAEPDDRPKFMMIFAYPGVSGYLHVGHMRGYTYTDVITRYKRMLGYNVLFPVGTHASGNISINFAKKVERHDAAWLEYLRENGCPEQQITKLGEPDEVVRYFSKVYVDEYWKRFGFLADWRRFCTTIDDGYSKFIQWQFRKLNELGLLIQKPYFATFCPECGPVAVDPSETDISKGGNAEKQEYTLVKFRMGEDFIVAATLRPETMYGQTNFWADSSVEYVRAKVGEDTWIVSRPCAEKLSVQKDGVEIVGTIPGKELIGKLCHAPSVERDIMILPGDFCDPNVGTGLVTSVPSDAPWDWIALRDIQGDEQRCLDNGLDPEAVKAIQPIPIIKTKGYGDLPAVEICERLGIESQEDVEKLEEATKEIYKTGFHTGVMNDNCGPFAGLRVEVAKDRMKEALISAGDADTMQDLSEEVVCRCGAQVVVKRIDDQWFIKYSQEDWTEKAKGHAEAMNIYPKDYHNNLPNVLDWFDDRACARMGSWLGTRFPLDEKWIIEPISDSTLYPIYYLISLYVNEHGLKPEQMTEEFFDYVFLGRGEADDVAGKTGASAGMLDRIKADVAYWYPLDINLGGKEHMTVHFPVFQMNHVAILPGNYWPRGVFVHWYIVGKGSKISKSKGGAQPIPGAVERYTVDGLRLYYCHSASPFVDVEWDETVVSNYKQRIDRTIKLLEQLGAADGDPAEVDKWLESRLSGHIESVGRAMEGFDIRAAANSIFFDVAADVRWYLKRGGGNSALMDRAADAWVRMMAPVIPHNAEELWESLGKEGLVSAASYPKPEDFARDEEAEAAEGFLRAVQDDISEILKVTKMEPKRIVLYTSAEWKRQVFEYVAARDELDVGPIMKELMARDEIKRNGKAAGKFIPQTVQALKRMSIDERQARGRLLDERAYLLGALDFLKREFGCELAVYAADEGAEDPQNKARFAQPWRPAIYVE